MILLIEKVGLDTPLAGALFEPDLVVALTVNPVSETAVVTGIVLLDQFVCPIRQNIVRQFFNSFPFSVSSTFGVVLICLLFDTLKRVIGDGGDQGSPIKVVKLLSDFLPPFCGDTDFPSHVSLLLSVVVTLL
jgi:hypothetical protein